jgi:hypothetical protein
MKFLIMEVIMNRYVILLLVCTGFLFAQDGDATRKKIGLGVNLPISIMENYKFNPSGNPGGPAMLGNLNVAFRSTPMASASYLLMPELKIVAELGLTSWTEITDGDPEVADDFFMLALGASPRYVLRENNMELQVGVRYAFAIASMEDETDQGGNDISVDKTSFNMHVLGVLAGGEYFMSPYFSAGGEIQLNYSYVGADVPGNNDISLAAVSIDPAVRINWYFF